MPMRDLPLHVDFMRLGEGATIRVNIPIHVRNADQSPGVKRGGTVSIVTHTVAVRCRADAIPAGIEVDISELEINHSRHLSDITLPEGVRSVLGRDITLVTVVPPSGYAEEMKAAAEAAGRSGRGCRSRCRRHAGRGRGAWRRSGCGPWRSSGCCTGGGPQRLRRSEVALRGTTPMLLLVGLGNPGARYVGNRHNVGFMAVQEIAKRHGIGPWRRRFQGVALKGRSAASARCCCCPAPT